MDADVLALILAAGRGSRMEGLPEGVNKCALPIGGTSPVLHAVRVFFRCGVTRFCVVTGYAAESVESALGPALGKADISFVHNPFFALHGCNYSLARAAVSGVLEGVGRMVIAEGDSLLPAAAVRLLVESGDGDAVLLRPSSFIDPARSVVAVGRGGRVRRFAYDTEHKDALAAASMTAGEDVLGDSMQLWSFGGGVLRELVGELRRYGAAADRDGHPRPDSGVFSINTVGAPLAPVFAAEPEEWINLNTAGDVKKAEGLAWLAR